MKIVLVGNYAHDRQESMLRFAAALESGLARAGVAVEMIRPEPLFGRLRPSAGGFGKWLGYLDKFVVFPFALRKKIAHRRDVVVHICDHSNAPYTRHLRRVPHVVTCNDLLAIRSALGEFPQNPTSWTGRILQRWIANGLLRANRLACISEATRRDLLRVLRIDGRRATVIHMGQNHPYRPMPRDEAAMRLEKLRAGLPSRRFILHVGGNQFYKNRLGVLCIHARLRAMRRDAPALVLVGPPVAEEMKTLLAEDVIVFSDVGNEDLCALYSTAELLLFPSIAEGFGWPIAEAMACGCRVVTTGCAPMTEVGGDAAIYLNPVDESEGWTGHAATKVSQTLDQDAVKRDALIRAGSEQARKFATDGMIEKYLLLYREALAAG